MYWKNKRKCKYQKLVSIKSFFLFSALCPKVFELLPPFCCDSHFFKFVQSACVAGLVGKSKLTVA